MITKKKITALIIATAMVIILLPVAMLPAAAADRTVSIDGLTTASQIRNAIHSELYRASAGDAVTVTGTAAVTNGMVELQIPADITLVWKADLSNTVTRDEGEGYSTVINLTNTGVFEMAEGGKISISGTNSHVIGINVPSVARGAVVINVTGGSITATASDDHDAHAIGSSPGTYVTVNVSGGTIKGKADAGCAYCIDLMGFSNINISDKAYLEADSVSGVACTIDSINHDGPSFGTVNVTGGTIIANGVTAAPTTCIFVKEGNITISGGSLTSKSGGDSTDAIRLGDGVNPATPGKVLVSGGELSVTNNKADGANAFGIGIYNPGDSIEVTGGEISVTATGTNTGTYALFFLDGIRGNAMMSGGTITSSALTHAFGIKIYDGTATVTGGSISATSVTYPGFAINIRHNGVAAYLTNTFAAGVANVTATGIIVEADKDVIPSERRGSSTGLRVRASRGITSAGAQWDSTVDSVDLPYIEFTGNGAEAYPKLQWGSYEAAEPTPEPTPTPTPSDLLPADREKVTEFVTRLYDLVLKRVPDSSYSYWIDRLVNREITGIDALCGFFLSIEMKNNGLTDEEFVDLMYAAIMNRPADAEGKEYWVGKLAAGAPRAVPVMGFATSEEFKNICAEAGIENVPSGSKEAMTRAFVARLYYQCLDREPAPEEVTYHASSLISGISTGRQVAGHFVLGAEMIERNVSNEVYVQICYAAILGRDCEDWEVAHWAGLITSGTSRQQIFQGFVNSLEFSKICAEYGITP